MKDDCMRLITGFLLLLLVSAAPSYAQTVEPCGLLTGGYGPYDYLIDKDKLPIVEGAHFLPFVENLTRGNTSTTPGGDIDYTLRAFPNHHRALMSMIRLAEKEKTEKPSGSRYTIACWFERAIRFRQDDGMVRALFASYLAKKGKNLEARQEMLEAEKAAGENANLHYNLGLTYFQVKDYEKSLNHAHRAYDLGFPLAGLRNLLTGVGKWSEQGKATDKRPNAEREAPPIIDGGLKATPAAEDIK